ncbi:ROK family protein [Bremerella cremea]|uniref:ROK family protein n=1 Tax=Bremerella cremea TaxID=1031537 RepID=A0A368KLV3_9BACT|nr:ROK family protein [Bremerella cremea]RCS40800.1 ROK family protein [Bremerella cremea]
MASAPRIEPGKETLPLFIGVDVGGTNIKIGLVDDLGNTVSYRKIPTIETDGPQRYMERTTEVIQKICQEVNRPLSDITAIGLATPGTMDIEGGMLLEPHNLPNSYNFPIRDCLSQLTGRPVIYANDANAAAFGEYWLGSGKEFRSMILLTLGTGVGGGIIVDDLLIDGEHSHGGELGHIIIDFSENARTIPTGQRGHLEAYASGTAIIKRTHEALAGDLKKESSLHRRVENGEPLTPLMVSEEASQGDSLSLHIVLETARYLGIGIVSLMHTIDPGAVVLGGAINFGGHESPLGRQFLERVRQEVKSRAFPVPAEKTVVDFARLGGDAGYLGAAGKARAVTHRDSLNS